MRIEVDAQQFEELTRDLLERTETTTSLGAWAQAGLDLAADRPRAPGGRVDAACRWSCQMLRKLTGKEPDCSQSPDEAVAHGAALYAAMLSAEPGAPLQAILRAY